MSTSNRRNKIWGGWPSWGAPAPQTPRGGRAGLARYYAGGLINPPNRPPAGPFGPPAGGRPGGPALQLLLPRPHRPRKRVEQSGEQNMNEEKCLEDWR